MGIFGLISSAKKNNSESVLVQHGARAARLPDELAKKGRLTHQQRIQDSREKQLDQQRRQAQYEAEQLRKQLSDSASYTAAPMQSMKAEMARLQDTVVQAEQEKTEMQDELEKAKSTTVVQNITYNIQDSAIAGDINATGLKEKDD